MFCQRRDDASVHSVMNLIKMTREIGVASLSVNRAAIHVTPGLHLEQEYHNVQSSYRIGRLW